ncbi:MAG: 1,4-alpha-glucan branching protein GlgB [Verrucomicrobiota bacterium]
MPARTAERPAPYELADPHAYLGAHPAAGGVLIRAYRPDAESIRVLPMGLELDRVQADGLFEGTVEGAELPLAYELEVRYPAGDSYVVHDPYAFLPTVGELDVHLAAEGRHEELYARVGAQPRVENGVAGVAFSVWAPNAASVSVVGDFNGWDGRLHPMRSLGASGIWELFVPEMPAHSRYKFEIRTRSGSLRLKADPLAFATEVPPRNASVVFESRHEWGDGDWIEQRRAGDTFARPLSIYEVHLGSWRLNPVEGTLPLTYAELAAELAEYVTDLGFTHVELLPVMEHPYAPSWGYQVTGYFAPTSRFGSPDDFRAFVDTMHEAGIGVILDWVPAHFPKDDWALARFDGTALYEHEDPRRGEHPDWGTLVFNYGRNEVRNFLLASALFWLRDYHADGLRVDAVASMLYLDYSRKEGEWVPNVHGGNEDLDAIEFLRELNTVAHGREAGVLMIAEESTAWPGVSRPVDHGGLGFGLKWNMGWMHDTLVYFAHEPVHRRYHHGQLTFSMVYAFSENFVLPLSHDEVVHGKGSLLAKMPGDPWQKRANLRALYGYMWAHPGKKLLFMGGELGQVREWRSDDSIDWHLLEQPEHAGIQELVRDLNFRYRDEPALWEIDFDPEGFRWLEANDADSNVIVFVRFAAGGRRVLVCACNFSPVPRPGYRIGLPRDGRWRELINTDGTRYGGGGIANAEPITAEARPWHDQPYSAELTLPPLAVLWLVPT